MVQGLALALVPAAAALLPGLVTTSEAVGADTARLTVRHGGPDRAVDLRVDGAGPPVELVVFQRWSEANPDRTHRAQPIRGRMSEFREVGGDRLPFRVEAGTRCGTAERFAVFLAAATASRVAGAAP